MTTLLRWMPDGKSVQLQGVYRRWTRYGVVTAPEGFVSDGASIPGWVYLLPGMALLFPKSGRHNWASVVHDFIYRTQPEGWTRLMADVVFLDIMLEDGTPEARARVMYRAVRVGAGRRWRQCAKALAE